MLPQSTSNTGPEYAGPAALQAIQHALYAQRALLSALPGTFCQGRTFGLMNANRHDALERLEQADWPARVLLHLPRTDSEMLCPLLAELGYACDPPYDLLVGAAEEVRCRTQSLAASPLPPGWRTERLHAATPSRHVRALQMLQQDAGLTPVPGWVLRGLDGHTRTTLLMDSTDGVRGAVSLQRLVFGGEPASMGFGLCIAPEQAGRGLAQLLNARAMTQAIKAGARWTMEIVAPTSSASRRVNEACGLARHRTDCFVFAQRLQSSQRDGDDQHYNVSDPPTTSSNRAPDTKSCSKI